MLSSANTLSVVFLLSFVYSINGISKITFPASNDLHLEAICVNESSCSVKFIWDAQEGDEVVKMNIKTRPEFTWEWNKLSVSHKDSVELQIKIGQRYEAWVEVKTFLNQNGVKVYRDFLIDGK